MGEGKYRATSGGNGPRKETIPSRFYCKFLVPKEATLSGLGNSPTFTKNMQNSFSNFDW